MVLLRTDVTR